jgi:tetratricopeptide (TPR) repeat protein
MKRILMMLAAAMTIFTACKDQTTTAVDANAQYKTLYDKSMKLKDLHTAIYAIQMILITDSTNGLRDSLPELYGGISNIEACMQTNEETLKRHPNEEKFKNIKVLCLQQLGDVDGQFLLLEDLYKTTKKPQYIAQMASLQLASGDVKEATKTVDYIIEEFKSNKTDSLDIFLDETQKQKVPVLAAAYNMKGYILMQQKNINGAKDAYFKALEIYPDFVMPKRNLEMIFARK